jgi:ubiquinone/menaquinone biosynthesis C-methylase UbiE
MISKDVGSVLDAGSGDGRVIKYLPKHLRPISIDYFNKSLLRGIGHRIRASAESLPFRDKSFDLVLCTEVFEHLP